MRALLAVSAFVVCTACECNSFEIIGELDAGPPDAGEPDAGAPPCTVSVSCYSYDAGMPGTGACLSGTAECLDGRLGPCVGELGPSAEACNGVDDDCNGVVDDPSVLGNVTCGVGACRASVPACVNGKPSTCSPGTPVPEVCSTAADENCDGVVNEGCKCIHVSLRYGRDSGTGTATNPVRTIAQGIALAVDGGVTSLCVGGGSCPMPAPARARPTTRRW
jgi:hypothetical protein